MPTPTEAQIARLPVWARRERDRLAQEVDYWRQQATAGPANSDTFVDRLGDDDRPLGTGTRIRFQHGPGRWDHLTVRLARGAQDGSVWLEIQSGEALEVQPLVSNVVRVRAGSWWK